MVLLSDNHVIAQCEVFISISTGNAELSDHLPQSLSNKILASLNSGEVLPQLDQCIMHPVLSTLK